MDTITVLKNWTKTDFSNRFVLFLERCIQDFEPDVRLVNLDVNFELNLYGTSEWTSVDDLVELVYITDELFYRIIDVAVLKITPEYVRFLVRPSGHDPVPLHETRAYVEGWGPFNCIYTAYFFSYQRR